MMVAKSILHSHCECNGSNLVSKQNIADGSNNLFVDVGSKLAKRVTVADNIASIPTPCVLTQSLRTK